LAFVNILSCDISIDCLLTRFFYVDIIKVYQEYINKAIIISQKESEYSYWLVASGIRSTNSFLSLHHKKKLNSEEDQRLMTWGRVNDFGKS